MSFQLQDVITAARDRHPAFHRTRVTDAVFARFLTDYQNELIAKCVHRLPHFLDQSVGIVLAAGSGAPGTVGAGTAGGLPAASPTPGAVSAVEQTSGALVDVLTDSASGATVWVPDRVVTAATANTVQSTGAGRATNQDLGRTVEITAGTGYGQRAVVASNTLDTWTLTTNWAVRPDATSIMRVATPLLAVSDDLGVVTQLPALATKSGYLVRLDAQGTPFLDYTQPLVANFETGVPLPSIAAITGGTVYFTDGERDALTIVSFGERFRPRNFPAIWQSGESVRLCGTSQDWLEVQSIELLYTPVAPKFAALTDYFLLPDAARRACVAQAAAFAALRLSGTEDIHVDARVFQGAADSAEGDYLGSLRLSKRARTITFRDGFGDS